MRRRSQTVEGILEILNTVGRGAHALLDRAEFFLRMFLSDEGNIVTLGSTIATIAGVIYWSIFPDYFNYKKRNIILTDVQIISLRRQ
jgi:hypothetical protein